MRGFEPVDVGNRVIGRVIKALVEGKGRIKRAVLSKELYSQLANDVMSQVRFVSVVNMPATYISVMGVKCVLEEPTGFCRNCGAPTEPLLCSFCLSPSEWVHYVE